MKYLETEEEKKSFAITSVLFVIMFILFFYLGLTSLDPPPENGIAINFGTTEFGSGDKQPTEAIQSAPQPTAAQQAASSDDEVLSQDVEDAPVMKQVKKPNLRKQLQKSKNPNQKKAQSLLKAPLMHYLA